jgi:hypothetical protein
MTGAQLGTPKVLASVTSAATWSRMVTNGNRRVPVLLAPEFRCGRGPTSAAAGWPL